MIYKNDHQYLIFQQMIKFIVIFCLITLILNIVPFSGTAQHQNGIGMEGADVIVVKEHNIFLIQDPDSSNKVFYEEEIFYQNIGSENYSGKLYTWSPEFIEPPLFKPVITSNGTEFETDKLQPTLNFLYLNLSKEGISIKPNETLKVVFKFNLDYRSTDKFKFRRIFLYDNYNVFIIIKTNKKYKAEGEEGLELYYEPTTETYANKQHGTFSQESGESISISFTQKSSDGDQNGEENENDSALNSSNFFYVVIIIVILILICIIYFRHRTREKSTKIQTPSQTKRKSSKIKTALSKKQRIHEKQKIQKSNQKSAKAGKSEIESDQPSRKKLILEKKTILKTTNRLKKDYKEGLISKEIFDNLKDEYKQKLKIINKKLEKSDVSSKPSPEMEKLLAKKEKILKAINKLEEDRKSGDLDEDLYEEMVGTYKKQAIEILKKIDILKERES